MKITANKTNYLIVPHEILSWIKADRILIFGHFLPSFIVTSIFVLKILPEISEYYKSNLENNSIEITITFILCLIPTTLLNGIIIEKMLIRYNSKYSYYKESLKKVYK